MGGAGGGIVSVAHDLSLIVDAGRLREHPAGARRNQIVEILQFAAAVNEGMKLRGAIAVQHISLADHHSGGIDRLSDAGVEEDHGKQPEGHYSLDEHAQVISRRLHVVPPFHRTVSIGQPVRCENAVPVHLLVYCFYPFYVYCAFSFTGAASCMVSAGGALFCSGRRTAASTFRKAVNELELYRLPLGDGNLEFFHTYDGPA